MNIRPRSAPPDFAAAMKLNGGLSVAEDEVKLSSFARIERPIRAVQSDYRSVGQLRIALLTPTLLMGGAERWMISLGRCSDPRRIEWTGVALTDGAPASNELCREMATYMPIYAGPGAGPSGDSPFIVRCLSA